MQNLEERVHVKLRWRDFDVLQHLTHSVYHDLLEEGRARLLEQLFDGILGDDKFILAHVDLDYRAEVLMGHGEVDVIVRVAGCGTSSIRLDHEVTTLDGTCAASGTSVLVAWDSARRRTRKLSPGEVAILQGGT